MKKTLFLLAIAAIIFTSCKKEHGLTTKALSAKKYAVNIQVTNFTTSHANFALRTKGSHLASSSDTLTDLASYIDLFYYVVLDSNYHWVKTIVQDSTYCSAMGTITDSLPRGQYHIAMVAGKNGLEITKPTSSLNLYFFGYGAQPWQDAFWTAYPDGYVGLPWQDTFWNIYGINVGPGNNSYIMTLNRVVGKLEVTLLDNIPANADSLFISVTGPSPGNLLNGSGPVSDVNVFPVAIPASAKGQPNFTVDRLAFSDDLSYYADNVTITCKDAGGNVLGSATVNPVLIHANQKTILSGNLFGNSAPQSFTAQIDTAWSSGVTQTGFSLKHH
jgi:hypothetical protein